MKTLKEKVDELRKDAEETANGLQYQIDYFSQYPCSKEEAEEVVFDGCDFLKLAREIEENSELWKKVRDIQQEIIKTHCS